MRAVITDPASSVLPIGMGRIDLLKFFQHDNIDGQLYHGFHAAVRGISKLTIGAVSPFISAVNSTLARGSVISMVGKSEILNS